MSFVKTLKAYALTYNPLIPSNELTRSWILAESIPSLDEFWEGSSRSDWLLWILRQSDRLNKTLAAGIAVKCAQHVLGAFEDTYAESVRPRRALDAAAVWLREPTEHHRREALDCAAGAAQDGQLALKTATEVFAAAKNAGIADPKSAFQAALNNSFASVASSHLAAAFAAYSAFSAAAAAATPINPAPGRPAPNPATAFPSDDAAARTARAAASNIPALVDAIANDNRFIADAFAAFNSDLNTLSSLQAEHARNLPADDHAIAAALHSTNAAAVLAVSKIQKDNSDPKTAALFDAQGITAEMADAQTRSAVIAIDFTTRIDERKWQAEAIRELIRNPFKRT